MPRRASKGTNPGYQTHHWRNVIRPYWIAQRQPCARCGGAIDYDSPVRNAASLTVGHIIGVDQAKRLRMPDAQVWALANTQPEHRRCSDRSGARWVNAKRGQRRQVVRRPTMLVLDDW